LKWRDSIGARLLSACRPKRSVHGCSLSPPPCRTVSSAYVSSQEPFDDNAPRHRLWEPEHLPPLSPELG
jgi:hypothetical protein